MARRKLQVPEPGELRDHVDATGLVQVRVTPNASGDAVTLSDSSTKAVLVRTTATPEDGKANKAVASLLAKALDVPGSSVSLVRGANSRNKLFRVLD